MHWNFHVGVIPWCMQSPKKNYMGLSENSVPLHPMVLLIIIRILNGYFIGNIPNIFSYQPIWKNTNLDGEDKNNPLGFWDANGVSDKIRNWLCHWARLTLGSAMVYALDLLYHHDSDGFLWKHVVFLIPNYPSYLMFTRSILDGGKSK